MLVLKEKGVVYIAISTASLLCTGFADSEWYNHEENLSVWKIPNEDDIVVGMGGCGFVRDLFAYDEDFIRGELTLDKMILEVIPKIQKRLRRYDNLNKKDNEMRAAFVFAQKDRAFSILSNFVCAEIEEIAVCGADFDIALPALRIAKELPPEQRLLLVNDIVNQAIDHPSSPLCVINTKTCKPYLLRK